MKITTDYDPEVDFSPLKKYAWDPTPRPPGDPQVDNTLFDARVRRAVDAELATRGFQKVAEGSEDTADFWINYHAALAHAGNRRARIASRVLNRLDHYISSTQLGITLASLGLGWVGESTIAEPRGNLTDDIYVTDGLRLVLFMSEERVTADRLQFIEWESPPID